MTREVGAHLAGSTRFWIVTPRVGTNGISGLNTLVSGAYIEMYPADGEPQREFVGLEDPPLLQPDTPGRAFTLTEDELGAVGPGTPVNYHGIQVGQVEGYALDPSGRHVNIYAFVRAPYDARVHDDTRFWDASAIDVSAGPQGLRVRVNSLQQLLTGAIGFDTPASPAAAAEAVADKAFPLYESETVALRNHSGPRLNYVLRFDESAAGLQPGTPVQLRGVQIGEVLQAQLVYDTVAGTLYESASMAIDPGGVQLVGMPHAAGPEQTSAVRAGLARLVAARPARPGDHGQLPHRSESDRPGHRARRPTGKVRRNRADAGISDRPGARMSMPFCKVCRTRCITSTRQLPGPPWAMRSGTSMRP